MEIDLVSKIKDLPNEVKKIFTIFQGQAYLVGGSVRNLLLKREIADFDFASKLSPNHIIEILSKNNIKYIDQAIKYGTIIAVINKRNIEITSFRKDLKSDGRHPQVKFGDDMLEDAKRRDFTINALYLDQNGQLYDFFDSYSDLQKGIVRFIGNPEERIIEDRLRILRFFRFSCYYSKEFNQEGLIACVKLASEVKKLSSERIRQELVKILDNDDHQSLINTVKSLSQTGVLNEIYLNSNNQKIIENLYKIEKTTINHNLKLVALFYNQKLQINTLSERLALTKKEKLYFVFFDKNYPKSLDREEMISLLAKTTELDILKDLASFYLANNYKEKTKENFNQFIKLLNSYTNTPFPLVASDLIKIGIKNNQISKTIINAKQLWIENDFKLKKIDLINFTRRFLS